MIELIDFTKNYYDFPHKSPSYSVCNINLKAEDGKITALLGPNGSGKTTILKSICKFHNPSGGIIKITDSFGNIIDYDNKPEDIMENIGYVPEISVLPDELKVIDFLNYIASIHSFSIINKDNQIQEVIKNCGLEQVLNKKIKNLSKGYKQRISFAQAIIHNPQNLILDEPISGLDPSQIVQMRNLIKDYAKTKSVIISTHILQEVSALCSNIYIINSGKLVAEGTEEKIIKNQNSKNFEEAFIKLTSDSLN